MRDMQSLGKVSLYNDEGNSNWKKFMYSLMQTETKH